VTLTLKDAPQTPTDASAAKFTLGAGNYVFLLAGAGGEAPGVPPTSMAVLEVLP
jgi:hypothetical protein